MKNDGKYCAFRGNRENVMNHNQRSDTVTVFWKSVQITVSLEEVSAAVETTPQSQGGFPD